MFQLILARFPALPASIAELMRLSPSDPHYYEKALKLGSCDPGLASEIVKMANAAGVCPTVPIRSVREALLHVGPRPAIARFLGGEMLRVFAPCDPVMRALWTGCVRTAAACAHLATDHPGPRQDPHEARTVGLLHNLGQIALACVDRERYATILSTAGAATGTLLHLERITYGADHAALGADLALAWGFGGGLTYVMRHHHDVVLPPGPDNSMALCRLVAFAAELVEGDIASPPAAQRAIRLARGAGIPLDATDLPALAAKVNRLAHEDLERLGLLEPAWCAGALA